MSNSVPVVVPMILTCPLCNARHIDAGEFATKVHHTHSCQTCGFTWRPSVVPTVGVQFLPGFKDEPVQLAEKTIDIDAALQNRDRIANAFKARIVELEGEKSKSYSILEAVRLDRDHAIRDRNVAFERRDQAEKSAIEAHDARRVAEKQLHALRMRVQELEAKSNTALESTFAQIKEV